MINRLSVVTIRSRLSTLLNALSVLHSDSPDERKDILQMRLGDFFESSLQRCIGGINFDAYVPVKIERSPSGVD